MTLMQISEPGQSQPKAACRRPAIGIDLGTTNSLVACVRDGSPVILCGGEQEQFVPSVVQYRPDGTVLVGRRAVESAAEYPRDTIVSVKRFIGRGRKDSQEARERTPYEFDDGDERVVRFRVGNGQRVVTPMEVSAEILKVLTARAKQSLEGDLEGAVITVPAYFDDAQRQATRDAGRLAGLEVLRLLAEPTAAALAYGLDKNQVGTYAVYDLGGGTFDISILKLTDGVFEVKATGGDSALGGDDIDYQVAEAMLSAVEASQRTPLVYRRAFFEARRVKEQLTQQETARFVLELPGGARVEEEVDRARLADLARPLLEKTGRACKRALKDAEIRAKNLDGVLVVGGSTRSPVVLAYVQEVFGQEPMCSLSIPSVLLPWAPRRRRTYS